MKQIHIGNVKIDDLSAEEALDFALDAKNAPCFVVTPNALMVEKCRKDPQKAELLNRASLSLADGIGIQWAARLQGTPIRARIAGIDFGERLLAYAAQNGLRVFLLGGGEGIAELAANRLTARYRGLCVCGTYWGYFAPTGEDDQRLIAMLRAVRPDVLLVCMGFPRQEAWIDAHLDRLSDVQVLAGLGGSLDVWAGKLRRAPRWISRLGLEWAWRIALEPKKRFSQIPLLLRFGIFGGRYLD